MIAMDILDSIENGKMSVRDGISLIANGKKSVNNGISKGNFLKINVNDEESNFNITVPIFLLSAGFSLTRFAASLSSNVKMDDNAKKVMEAFKKLDKKDIKLLVSELRKCKSSNFIEVHSKDSHVSISVV